MSNIQSKWNYAERCCTLSLSSIKDILDIMHGILKEFNIELYLADKKYTQWLQENDMEVVAYEHWDKRIL